MASVMLSGEPPHLANDDRSLDGGAASTEAVASTGQRQRQTAAVLEGAVWETWRLGMDEKWFRRRLE